MKKLFKWLFRLILLLVILAALLVVCLDPIAKAIAERVIQRQTGMVAKIGKLSIGLKSPTISVENLKLTNPPEFGGTVFLDIPELRVNYDLAALRDKRIHFTLVRFNLGELDIVQNRDGKTNLRVLREHQKQKSSSGQSFTGYKPEYSGIDRLTLSIGRLKFINEKNLMDSREVYVGLKGETITNVMSFADLQPLFTRIALEKGADFLTRNLFDATTNRLSNTPKSGGQDAQNKSTRPAAGQSNSQ